MRPAKLVVGKPSESVALLLLVVRIFTLAPSAINDKKCSYSGLLMVIEGRVLDVALLLEFETL